MAIDTDEFNPYLDKIDEDVFLMAKATTSNKVRAQFYATR